MIHHNHLFLLWPPALPTRWLRWSCFTMPTTLSFAHSPTVIPPTACSPLITSSYAWETVQEVSSKYPHMKSVGWKLRFYCPASLHHGRTPHVAVCPTINKPKIMECQYSKEDDHSSLESKSSPPIPTELRVFSISLLLLLDS